MRGPLTPRWKANLTSTGASRAPRPNRLSIIALLVSIVSAGISAATYIDKIVPRLKVRAFPTQWRFAIGNDTLQLTLAAMNTGNREAAITSITIVPFRRDEMKRLYPSTQLAVGMSHRCYPNVSLTAVVNNTSIF